MPSEIPWFAPHPPSFVHSTNVDVNVSAYDLSATYLPGWEAVVKEGKALGVMCSYNMVNCRVGGANNCSEFKRVSW